MLHDTCCVKGCLDAWACITKVYSVSPLKVTERPSTLWEAYKVIFGLCAALFVVSGLETSEVNAIG